MIELILLAIGFTLIGLGIGFMVALCYIQRRVRYRTEDLVNALIGEVDSKRFSDIQKTIDGVIQNDRDNDS